MRDFGYLKGSFAANLWQTPYAPILPWIVPWQTRYSPCNGDEATLLDCVRESQAFGDTPEYYCYGENIVLGCALRPGSGTFGDLRLVDTSEDEFVISGRLQVFNEFWGSLCQVGYDQAELLQQR